MYVRYRLFEYAEFFAYLDECGDTLVELALVMRSGNLDTDSRLVLRNDRVVETCYIDAFLLHFRCENL